MFRIIMLIIYILLILAVIFLERKSPTEAMLWVLVLVCLPYLGLILYLVFGATFGIKLTAFMRRRRLEKRIKPEIPDDRPDISELSEEDLQVIRFNAVYNKSRLTGSDDISVYTSGREHYAKLFEDIAGAKDYIFAEFYTVHHDEVGRAFVNALAEKARQGVTVLLLIDSIANLNVPKKMFKPLISAGGKVIRIKPYLTHFRSHRKIVTIDSDISYIGGMNIGRKYANLSKKKNPWRDTQVRMKGACTYALTELFLTDWLCAVKRRNWDKTVQSLEKFTRPAYPPPRFPCQFIVGGVDTDRESVKMCYLSMIHSAKRTIRIQTPYFIPDVSLLDALKTAAASGVKIELMLPGQKSNFFLDPVTRFYVGQLLQYGAKAYRYNGYVHAKTMIIDRELCCIGSVNMDIRSLKVDDEICGVFYSDSFVRKYIDIFKNDLTECKEYKLEEYENRSTMKRLSESFFLPFAPLM